jgi:hypothetical protein
VPNFVRHNPFLKVITPVGGRVALQAMGHRLSKCRLRRRLIDRLTHHAEIISIDGESYRKREAEQAQKRKQESKPKR